MFDEKDMMSMKVAEELARKEQDEESIDETLIEEIDEEEGFKHGL